LPVVGGRPKSLTEQGIEHVNGLQDEVGGENRRSVRCIYRTCGKTSYQITLFGGCTQAGFPSPADDYIEGKLDLNAYLVRHPSATFFVRVAGDSMIEAGIHDGDILVVDRAVRSRSGHVVVAVLDGEFTVKRLRLTAGRVVLQPANPVYPAIEVAEEADFEIWGVVTAVIHKV